MFLQALGADNETIIYLSAIGEGTEIEPYKSIFLSQQYEDWSVTILNPSIAVTGTFYLDIQPVSQSGEWTINLSQDTISALNTVNVNLDQPLTLTQLEAITVKVEEQQPLDLQALDSLDNKLPAGLTVDVDRLKVDTAIALPSIYSIEAAALPLPNGASTEAKQTEAITKLASIDTKLPQLSLQGDNLKVNIGDYSNLVTALEAATLKANINNTVSVISDVVLDVSPVVEIIEETNSAIGLVNTDNTTKQNEIITKLGDISTQLGTGLTTTVGNLPSVQPVSQSGTWTVGLPSGASTAANQTIIDTTLNTINTKLPSNLTVTSNRLLVDNSGVTQPVSGSVTVSNQVNPLTDTQLRASAVTVNVTDYSELITLLEDTRLQTDIKNNVSVIGDFYNNTGLATDANQFISNNLLEDISQQIPNITQPLTDSQLRASAITVSVDNFPAQALGSSVEAIQSGIWDITDITGNISLPTGASTAANQSIEISHLQNIETSLGGTIDVNTNLNQPLTNTELRASDINVTVSNFPVNQTVSLSSLPSGTNAIGSITNSSFGATQSGVWNINNIDGTIPLPTGATTEIKQDIIIGHIDSIETALAGALTVDTGLVQAITNSELRAAPVEVTVDNFPATQIISGTVTANTGLTQPLTNTELRASAITTNSNQSGVWNVSVNNQTGLTDTELRASDIGVSVSNFPASQIVNIATGSNVIGAISNTEFSIDNFPLTQQIAGTISVDNFPTSQSITGTVTVDTGLTPLTNTELRASAIPVSGTFYPTVQDVSQSGTWNINNISGIISLPTGAATASNQTIEINHLANIETSLLGVIEVDTNLTQPLTNTELRATDVNVNITNSTIDVNLQAGSNVIGSIANTSFNVSNFPVTQQISGTVNANTGLTQPLTDAQLRSSAVPVSLATGSNVIGAISNTSFDVGNFPSSQAITASNLPLPTGASTSANQTTEIGHLSNIETAITGVIDVNTNLNQPLTNTELRATSVNVTVDNIPVTQQISGTVTANTGLTQPLTDTQLRATSVDVTVDNFPTLQEVNGTVNSNLKVNTLDVSDANPVPISLPGYLTTLFSRVRVANDENQISIRQDNPARLLMITEGQVSGTGTSSTYLEREASTLLTVGPTIGLRRLRSKVAGLYTTGNGLLCFYTFNLEGSADNTVAKRSGYFDDNDGIFLEETNNILYLVLRSSVSGTVVETKVPQSDWLYDKFDGTGQGYNFDKTKCHIGWISLEWLGVGDVYCGFVYNARPILAHVFRNPNLNSLPYMRTANLFINYEIERLSPGTGSSSIRAICGVLKTEGSLNKMGVTQIIQLGASRATASANTLYPLITFRLKSNYLNSRVLIEYFEAVINDNANTTARFLLVKNPVIAGYTFQPTSVPNSAIEYQNNLAPIIATNLTISSYEQLILSKAITINSNTFITGRSDGSPINFMGSSFNNTADLYCLAMTTTTASNTIPAATIYFWEQV